MLPIFQSSSRELSMLQTQWSSQLNPVLAQPQIQGIQLNDVALVVGANTINHLLGRKPQGWYIVDINGAATVYRSAPMNALTLTITSNAAVSVSIFVY
jgi:hypothetical protein